MAESKTVLLVDDDQDIISGADVRLRAAGYTTIMAHDGEQCVAAATETIPDAIVLDVRMPGTSGLQALSELRGLEETRTIPVIMLSASLVDRQAAMEAGARFFLTKPYQGKKLVAAVSAAIQESTDEGRAAEFRAGGKCPPEAGANSGVPTSDTTVTAG